jgi:hypothetical protein
MMKLVSIHSTEGLLPVIVVMKTVPSTAPERTYNLCGTISTVYILSLSLERYSSGRGGLAANESDAYRASRYAGALY